MNIHELMPRFLGLPNAEAGNNCTPSGWGKQVEKHLSLYPALSRYPDYVEFLRDYGGAGFYPDTASIDEVNYNYLHIYGFGRFADDYSEPVDENGFYNFALQQVRYRLPLPQAEEQDEDGMLLCYFMFDASGLRPPGVYIPTGRADEPYSLAWPSFTAWLSDLVSNNGRLSVEPTLIKVREAQVT